MDSWYLLYRKSGYRNTIQYISDPGLKVFQPMTERIVLRIDCNAVRFVKKSFFTSYLFLAFDINKVHTTTILKAPGAVTFILFWGEPYTVSNNVINSLKLHCYSSIHVENKYYEL